MKSNIKYARSGNVHIAHHRSRRRGQVVLIARDDSITVEVFFDPVLC
jgi:hypothetical protein